MKKTNLREGIACLVLGAAMVVFGIATKSDIGGLFCGLGGGLTGVGISYLHRWRVLHSDDQSDFAHHVRQTEIEQRDERNVMLRDRSAYITLNLLTVLLGAGWVALEAMHLLGRWTPFSGYAAVGCVVLCLLLWLCHWTVLHFVQKKM